MYHAVIGTQTSMGIRKFQKEMKHLAGHLCAVFLLTFPVMSDIKAA